MTTKDIVSSIIGAFTAVSPIIINYFSKKSKDNAFKNLLDDSQTRINFINNYYDVAHKFLPDSELEVLKSNLAAELHAIKHTITEWEQIRTHHNSGSHNIFQKIFLTFRPVTFMGWVWAILFYFNLTFLSIVIIGMAIDEAGNFSGKQFVQSMNDAGGITAIILMAITLLLFRWLALRNYKHNPQLKIPATVQAGSNAADHA